MLFKFLKKKGIFTRKEIEKWVALRKRIESITSIKIANSSVAIFTTSDPTPHFSHIETNIQLF
ncbi:MAG: hypothetical protein HON09_09080 [Flavobacteriaceae bacterium]|nr:hypothetical protein [Flavobacteriaceae bacterium]